MRRLILITCISVTLTSTVVAQSLEAGLRAASAMAGIVDTCGPFFALNGPRATQMMAVISEAAERSVGREKARRLLKQEFARRKREIAATGAGSWCNAQRALLSGAKDTPFLN